MIALSQEQFDALLSSMINDIGEQETGIDTERLNAVLTQALLSYVQVIGG